MQRRTSCGRVKSAVLALLAGGIPLITIASCDPRSGTFDLYRDTNHGDYYGDYYYDDYYYDDCWHDCGYGYDDYFIFDW